MDNFSSCIIFIILILIIVTVPLFLVTVPLIGQRLLRRVIDDWLQFYIAPKSHSLCLIIFFQGCICITIGRKTLFLRILFPLLILISSNTDNLPKILCLKGTDPIARGRSLINSHTFPIFIYTVPLVCHRFIRNSAIVCHKSYAIICAGSHLLVLLLRLCGL